MTGIRHALAAVLLLSAAPVFAQAHDPTQCARIDDVAVPYEVQLEEARVRFSAGDSRIDVDAEQVVLDGRGLAHGDPGYYADLRRFLGEADRTAREVKPIAALLRGRGAELAQTATRMCAAILALADSSARVEAAMPGFESPVRIRLK